MIRSTDSRLKEKSKKSRKNHRYIDAERNIKDTWLHKRAHDINSAILLPKYLTFWR